jgi:hypothetical protein
MLRQQITRMDGALSSVKNKNSFNFDSWLKDEKDEEE